MENDEQQLKYSAVIPCYGSESTVRPLVERLTQVFEELGAPFEILMVDDASPDDVASVIRQLNAENPRVKLLRHFRNYGQHEAVLTGLRHAGGQLIVTLDDDLQHPPEEISKLLAGLGDSDVVVGVPIRKGHGWLRNLASGLVVFTLRRIFRLSKDFKASPFRVFRAETAKAIADLQTSYPYLAAMILQVTSRINYVPVQHEPRKVGVSNYRLTRLVRLTSNILFNYSKIPLQIMVALGAAISAISFLMILGIVITKLFFLDFNAGWASLITTIVFFGGLNLVSLSVIGEYVSRLVTGQSGARRVLIREAVGIDPADQSGPSKKSS